MIKFESLTWTTTMTRARRRIPARKHMEAALPEGGRALLFQISHEIPGIKSWRARINTPRHGCLGYADAETPKAAFQIAARSAVRRTRTHVEELRRTIQEVKRVSSALRKPGAGKLRRGR